MAIKHIGRHIMKKAVLGILAMALVVSMCAVTAFAAVPAGGYNFVDANGDGICDVCGAAHRSCPAGCGTAFTDADCDGICDNCGGYHRCGMAGTGCGAARGYGWGCGGHGGGHGHGHGHRHGGCGW